MALVSSRGPASRKLAWALVGIAGASSCIFELADPVPLDSATSTTGAGAGSTTSSGGGGEGGATGGGGASNGGGGGGGAGGVPNDWWDTNFAGRIRLDLDPAGIDPQGALIVPIALGAADVPPEVFASAGTDVRFVDADGVTELAHDRLAWGPDVGLAWVLVPDVGSTGDFIWLYFDDLGAPDGEDAAATWSEYVGTYHLEDNLLDESPAAHPGSGAAGYVEGRFGQAVDLAPLANGVVLGAHPDFQVAPGEVLSVELWFRRDGAADGGVLLAAESCCTGYQLSVNGTESFVALGTQDCCATGGTNYGFVIGAVPTDSGWHHMIATFDRTSSPHEVTAYLDGGAQGSGALPEDAAPFGPLAIGGDFGNPFSGAIDEVRVLRRAISSSEAAARFEATQPSFVTVGRAESLR